MKKGIAVAGFFPAAIATLLVSFLLLVKLPQVNEVEALLRQQARLIKNPPPDSNSAKVIPQVLGSFTQAVIYGDARPVIVCNYISSYKSPMEPNCELFIKKADEYGLKQYLLPIAIAQQESNLGKKTPINCHNAWGWGIHSKGTLCFPNWETAIDLYIRDFTTKYADILTIENENEMLNALMARYAPVSLEKANGSWAKGVKQFLDEMR